MTTYAGYPPQYNDGFIHQHQQQQAQQARFYANANANYNTYGAMNSYNEMPPQTYGYNNGYYPPGPGPAAQAQAQAPVAQDQNVVGGVSSVLDYDLKIMSKFTTYLAFRLFSRTDTDNAQFISKLQTILGAVRLPLSSLVLANYYLLGKYEKRHDFFLRNGTDEIIEQNVIISLLLANKANDDNTFTNKSWSEATGLPVRTINSLEVEWLTMLDWKLHNVDESRYYELKTQFDKYSEATKLQEQQQLQQYQQSLCVPEQPTSPLVNNNNNNQSWLHQAAYNQQPTHTTQQQPYSNYYQHGVSHQRAPSFNNIRQQQQPHHHHRKNYSLQFAPEFCARTGYTSKNAYCDCRFCGTTTVDWSYNNMLASAY